MEREQGQLLLEMLGPERWPGAQVQGKPQEDKPEAPEGQRGCRHMEPSHTVLEPPEPGQESVSRSQWFRKLPLLLLHLPH